MAENTIIPYLTEEELGSLKDGCKRGCTLQQLRQHTYRMNDVPEGWVRKIVNMEIDFLLLLKKKIKVFPRARITPEEMFYVLAYILEETELSNLDTSNTNYKRMSVNFIHKFRQIGEKAFEAYPKMRDAYDRIDYWWDYANKIRY